MRCTFSVLKPNFVIIIPKPLLRKTYKVTILKMPSIIPISRKLQIIAITRIIAWIFCRQECLYLRFTHRVIIPHLIIRNNISWVKIRQIYRIYIFTTLKFCRQKCKQKHRHKYHQRRQPYLLTSSYSHILTSPFIVPDLSPELIFITIP